VRFKLGNYRIALSNFRRCLHQTNEGEGEGKHRLDAELNIRRVQALMSREKKGRRVGFFASFFLAGVFLIQLIGLWVLRLNTDAVTDTSRRSRPARKARSGRSALTAFRQSRSRSLPGLKNRREHSAGRGQIVSILQVNSDIGWSSSRPKPGCSCGCIVPRAPCAPCWSGTDRGCNCAAFATSIAAETACHRAESTAENGVASST